MSERKQRRCGGLLGANTCRRLERPALERLETRALLSNALPIAVAGGPYSVGEGALVTFSSAGSSDPDGTIAGWEWDYDYDGVRFDVDSTTSSPVYSNWGTDGPVSRTIALRVKDNEGAISAPATASLTILNTAPTGYFYPSSGNVDLGESGTVTLGWPYDPSTADTSAGFRYSYDFDNDGMFEVADTSETTVTVPAEYLYRPGPFVIRGRIADKDGGWSDYTTKVRVNSDGGNVRWLGVAGGDVRDVEVNGSIAYAATGMRIEVLDISDRASPVLLSRLFVNDNVTDLEFSGGVLYAAASNTGLLAVNVSTPQAPTIIGRFDTPGTAQRLAAAGDMVYVADGSSLQIIDFSDPANPIRVGTFASTYCLDVALSGSYAYLAANTGNVAVVDVSHPAAPVLANRTATGWADRVTVEGNVLVTTASQELRVYDISNPAAPVMRDSFFNFGGIREATIVGSRAYVAGGASGLMVLNLANLDDLGFLGSLDTRGDATNVAVVGSTAFISDKSSGLVIADVSIDTAPVRVSGLGLTVPALDVVVRDSYAYTAAGFDGLQILDVSNATEPKLVGSLAMNGIARALYLDGRYAYVASDVGGLSIIDILDPANPRLIGACPVGNQVYGMAIAGNYAYVANWTDGLKILDISDLAQPFVVGSFAGATRASRVVVYGAYAYVADYENGLKVLDVSNPAAPTLVRTWKGASYVSDVAIANDRLYVGTLQDGLFSFDLSNPADPLQTDFYDVAGASRIAIFGDCVYATGNGQVSIVNFGSLPHGPTLTRAGAITNTSMAGSLQVYISGKRMYVSNGWDGLHIFSLQKPSEVPADSPAGTSIGWLTMQPTVADAPQALKFQSAIQETEQFTYSLVDGFGSDDNALFATRGEELTVAQGLDSEAGVTRSVRVRAAGSLGHVFENVFTIDMVDRTAPTAQSATINDGEAQRSMVRKVRVSFSEPVELLTRAISLRQRNGSLAPGVRLAAQPVGTGATWEITFSGTSIIGDSLPDGIYNLTISAAGVTDLAGNALATNYSTRFHRLFGDADGDRDVDNIDLNAFRRSSGQSSRYVWYFDYDNDHDIAADDLLQMRMRTRKLIR